MQQAQAVPSYPSAAQGGASTSGARPGCSVVKVSGTVFELDQCYTFLRPIGSGAYGVVISAVKTLPSVGQGSEGSADPANPNQTRVAIKKIPRAFDDLVDAKRILREIKLLRHLHHENIISLSDLLPPASLSSFEDVYIVSDLMETDLHRIIYSKQPLSIDHIQYFIYQVLRALKYMHSGGVLHRDLKPSNLLLNSNCDLKVCDFGLARGVVGCPSHCSVEHVHDYEASPSSSASSSSSSSSASALADDMKLTEYVVTRWYRAPEIMLACTHYERAIDIWSVGCILGELLQRQPLFPGTDYLDQLRLICAKIGQPCEGDLVHVTSARARRFIQGLPNHPPTPWTQLFPDTDARALDLLDRMLQFNPAKRISAAEALRHPFMESLHNEEDEPLCPSPFHFEHEHEDLNDKTRLQYLVLQEVLAFHPEMSHLQPVDPPRPSHPPAPFLPPQAPTSMPPPSSMSSMAPPPPPAAAAAASALASGFPACPPMPMSMPMPMPMCPAAAPPQPHYHTTGVEDGSVSVSMEVAGSTPLHAHTRAAQPTHNPFSTHALQQQQQQAAMSTALATGLGNGLGSGNGNQPQHVANNHPPNANASSNFHFYQQQSQQRQQQHSHTTHNPYGHAGDHSHSHSRGR